MEVLSCGMKFIQSEIFINVDTIDHCGVTYFHNFDLQYILL